jgi:hypothetical protein
MRLPHGGSDRALGRRARDLVVTAGARRGGQVSRAVSFQLHLTQVISIDPASHAKIIAISGRSPSSRSQRIRGLVQHPLAMTDFTGKRRDSVSRLPTSTIRLELDAAETIPAEMKGSLLLYTSSLYHGAPSLNHATRHQHHLQRSWLRQE